MPQHEAGLLPQHPGVEDIDVAVAPPDHDRLTAGVRACKRQVGADRVPLVSGRPVAPVPRSAMLVGVAETKTMEPIVAAATVTVPVADRFWLPTVVVAVIRSLPAQPRAT